jgi:hypothetical protein
MLGRNKLIVLLIGILGCLFFSVQNANAADLYFKPSSGSFSIGETVNINVMVDTKGVSINAVEATILFPKDSMEVVSVSKEGSIFSMWVDEPTFSNTNGTIYFDGGVPNPGFTGSAGKIISITFRAKKSGSTSLQFSPAYVYANDGSGTDVLENKGVTSIAIKEKESISQQIQSSISDILSPSVLSVSSSTHSNSNKWYSNNSPRFAWVNPVGVTGVSVYLSKKADSTPSAASDGLFSTYNYNNLEDGTWYFHVRLGNSHGWGQPAHFKINIDTKPPEDFEIKELAQDSSSSVSQFKFLAVDSGSGIASYSVSIDGGKEQAWNDSGDHIFQASSLSSGSHQIVAKAFDMAGNYSVATANFTVAQAAPVESKESKRSGAIGLDAIETLSGWISVLSLAIPFVAMIIILTFIVYYGWHKFMIFKMRLQKKMDLIERNMDKASTDINNKVKECVEALEQAKLERSLTSEETRILKEFKKSLEKIENLKKIKKEIKKLKSSKE